MQELLEKFVSSIRQTGFWEYLAVVSGIASVWFSKKENILVYPVGLVNTIIYTVLSFQYHLIGESVVNFYYTVVSIYGWWLWTRRDQKLRPVLRINFSSRKEWLFQTGFFVFLYLAFFAGLTFLKGAFYPGAIPWADAFATATAFTGMWLMARKKVESWYWWIATNLASIPLYFVKGLALTSVYYFILLNLAFAGWIEWKQKARANV